MSDQTDSSRRSPGPQPQGPLTLQELACRRAEKQVHGKRWLVAIVNVLISLAGFIGLQFVVVYVDDVVWRMVLAAVAAVVAGCGLAGWARFMGKLQVAYWWRESLDAAKTPPS